MNKNPQPLPLESAWMELLAKSSPPLTPQEQADKARRDQRLEQGRQFSETLNEPDKTIFLLSLHGWTHQDIARTINRSRGCVTKRLRKINALAEGLGFGPLPQ